MHLRFLFLACCLIQTAVHAGPRTSASGPAAQRPVSFAPIVAGRRYVVQFANSLSPANWQPLTGASQSENGDTRTVTDPNGTAPRRFYRVLVTTP